MHPTRSRLSPLCGVHILAAILVALPSMAQRVRFEPSIEVGRAYENDIDYAGSSDKSDSWTRLGLVLPVSRVSRTGSVGFRYRPTWVRYDDFDAFDEVQQRLDVDLSSNRPDTRMQFRTTFISTQAQGNPEQAEDPELFVTPRTDRALYQTSFDIEHDTSELWSWGFGLDAGLYTYDAISGFGSAVALVEDRTQYGGTLGFARRTAPNARLGVEYTYRKFDLDLTGEEDSHQLGARYRREVSRRLSLDALLGAYSNSTDLTGGTTLEDTGALTRLRLTQLFPRMRVALSLSHQPRAGGALRGTAVQSEAALLLASAGPARLRWRVEPRYARRDPADDTPTITKVGLRGSIERQFAGRYATRLRADLVDQDNTPDPTFTADLSFLWYPRGVDRR